MRRFVSFFFIATAVSCAVTAGAQAQSVSYAFDSDAQGWTTTQNGAPTWLAVNGNPGGNIYSVDQDSGDSETINFFRAPAGALDPDQIGGSLSLDYRLTFDPEYRLGVQVSSSEGSMICDLGLIATTNWATYSVGFSADDPCWTTDGTVDVTPQDFSTVMNGENLDLFVTADLTTAEAETPSLDNVIITAPELAERAISVSYSKQGKQFKGELKAVDAPITDVCAQEQKVEIYEVKSGKDARRGSDTTNDKGAFKVNQKAKKGKKYYALAPEVVVGSLRCEQVKSKTFKAVKG